MNYNLELYKSATLVMGINLLIMLGTNGGGYKESTGTLIFHIVWILISTGWVTKALFLSLNSCKEE